MIHYEDLRKIWYGSGLQDTEVSNPIIIHCSWKNLMGYGPMKHTRWKVLKVNSSVLRVNIIWWLRNTISGAWLPGFQPCHLLAVELWPSYLPLCHSSLICKITKIMPTFQVEYNDQMNERFKVLRTMLGVWKELDKSNLLFFVSKFIFYFYLNFYN